MYRVKILGAGSIGNHLANASRAMGWAVDICDVDPAALRRTQYEIYPARYGAWDEAINLYEVKNAPQDDYDLIFIGTPPDSHMDLAISAIAENPKAILIEKPLCGPGLDRAQELVDAATLAGVHCFVGYDHVVGKASLRVGELIAHGLHGNLDTLDVEIREHWGGIFGAHPWLNGPQDTYLGYWQRGGGACGEHSHGINLWQHFAHELGAGRVVEVMASLDYVNDGQIEYDRLCLINMKTESGLLGRVVQDVVTSPPRKWARIQGEVGHIEWQCNFRPGEDVARWAKDGADNIEETFSKTRPDDFIQELKHIQHILENDAQPSPLSLARGMDTMMVIAAAHQSAQSGKLVCIDYNKGYTTAALSS